VSRISAKNKRIHREIDKLPVFLLKMDELNYSRSMNNKKDKVKKIKKDIEKHGQKVPVLVCTHDVLFPEETGWNLKDGQHRVQAMKELGIETIKCRDITELKVEYNF